MISDSAPNVFVGTDNTKVGIAQGAFLLTTSMPYWIGTYAQLGPWITNAIYTCRPSGTSTTTFTEVVYVPTG
jgi:hypothetical protein